MFNTEYFGTLEREDVISCKPDNNDDQVQYFPV